MEVVRNCPIPFLNRSPYVNRIYQIGEHLVLGRRQGLTIENRIQLLDNFLQSFDFGLQHFLGFDSANNLMIGEGQHLLIAVSESVEHTQSCLNPVVGSVRFRISPHQIFD